MNQITELIFSSAIGILTILAGVVVKVVKETGFKGEQKLAQAKGAVLTELEKYNIYMTDKDLDVFIEAAVKQMNENLKGK